jgi:hypothetical protein
MDPRVARRRRLLSSEKCELWIVDAAVGTPRPKGCEHLSDDPRDLRTVVMNNEDNVRERRIEHCAFERDIGIGR